MVSKTRKPFFKTARLLLAGGVCFAMADASHAALTDNLDMYYSFDADTTGSGGFNDLSTNARDGSGIDQDGAGIDLAFSSDVAAAIGSGQSLDLGGTTDYLISDTPGYIGVAGANERTVAAWVKVNSLVSSTTLLEWGTNANGERWSVRLDGGIQGTAGALRLEVQGDYVIGTTALTDGQWHHIAVTFSDDGSPVVEDSLLYVDGVLQGTSANGTNTPAINTVVAGNVSIGNSELFINVNAANASSRQHDGLLDEVGIWSRALSAQEISDLAAGTVVPEPSSLALLGMGALLIARRRSS